MQTVSRRGFLTALAASQVRGAGERLRAGIIGCGAQGTNHIRILLKMRESDNVAVTAVSDVYDKRAQYAAMISKARVYRDYRQLLASADVDYVVIAAPDHWHARMCLDAAAAGKHVYCEKPMTHSLPEAMQVAARVRQTGIKLQVGVQSMSDDSYETAWRYVREGALGNVLIAQIDYSRNYAGDFWQKPPDDDVRPGVNLDWDMFLGPAPKRPFDKDRFLNWLRYWDYSGGVPSGLLVHRVTRLIKAMNLTYPEFGSAHGGKFQFTASAAEVPDTINIMLDYPGGPTVLLVSSLANDTQISHTIRGHKATLEFTAGGFVIRPQGLYQSSMKEIVHHKTGAESEVLHHQNLIRAIRSNEALKCDAQLGCYGVAACQFGVLSYRQRKYMKWDKEASQIVPA